MTDLAAQERAKIVFFLHRTIRRSIPTMDATWSAAFNAAIDYCADAIERGDHRVLHEVSK